MGARVVYLLARYSFCAEYGVCLSIDCNCELCRVLDAIEAWDLDHHSGLEPCPRLVLVSNASFVLTNI